MNKSFTTAAGIMLAGVLMTGCAAPGALDAARAAQAAADEAMRTAQAAHHVAHQALHVAETADACCDANTRRLDKEFHGKHSK